MSRSPVGSTANKSLERTRRSAQPVGAMKFVVLSCVTWASLVASCATPLPAPMPICDDRRFDEPVDEGILERALSKAAQWSNKEYGETCAVCAELYDDDSTTFTLHITSPVKNLINTSATMQFSRTNARTPTAGKYHSCHAWYVKDKDGA